MFQLPHSIPPQLIPYLSEPNRLRRNPIFDLNSTLDLNPPLSTENFQFRSLFANRHEFQSPPCPGTPSPVDHKDKVISPLSSVPNTPQPALPSPTPESPSRKVIRISSPIKDDGPPLDIEIVAREYSPALKELLVRRKTPSLTEKPITIPENVHPALTEAYIVKAAYKSMEDQRQEIWENMERVIEEQYKFGYNAALRLVLATCKIPIPHIADDSGPELSGVSKKFLSGLLNGKPPDATIAPFWKPPSYEEVDDHVDQMYRDDIDVVIGTLMDEEIRCGMDGQVECLNLLHCTGEIVLHVKTESEGEMALEMQVFGALCGRGVAMLLDKSGNVWLYNVPGAIGRPLRNFKHQLAMVLRAGEEGSPDKKLAFHEIYDSVELELIDPEFTREELLGL